MTEVSKERREELRLELSEGAPGMTEVSLFPDELHALLDMADERDRYRRLLKASLHFLTTPNTTGLHSPYFCGSRQELVIGVGAALEVNHD